MDSSFLFAGLHFDKKRFADDFNKFRKKPAELDESSRGQKEEDTQRGASFDGMVAGSSKKQAVVVRDSSSRKKKKKKKLQQQKRMLDGQPVNLFMPLRNSSDSGQTEPNDENVEKQHKQELSKKTELAGLIRKQHRIHVRGHDTPFPLANFEELSSSYGCKHYLMRNIANAGFKEPTAIQRQAIPVLLSERECFACAPTGSGKTLAFAIPILMKLKLPSRDGVRAVILCPTRELAKQITQEFKILVKGKKLRIRLMTKSLSRCVNFDSLPCDVLVSTPLRLDYVLNKSKINLSKVEFLVLDEADKLFEFGFVEQIDAVVNACTNPCILRCLFSATLPDSVEELARSIMHDAVRIVVGEKNSACQTIKQKLLFVGNEEGKILALRQLFQESLKPPVLVFVQSKDRAKELYRELVFEDIKADCIHADLTQAQREHAVERFREGKSWVLIATDLLARGMDFKGVNCVINFDFPNTTGAYIHRVGRSGRAGRLGEAITFYTEDDVPFLRPIVNVIVASGSEVPSWMLKLSKAQKKRHNPEREPISIQPHNKRVKRRVGTRSPAKEATT